MKNNICNTLALFTFFAFAVLLSSASTASTDKHSDTGDPQIDMLNDGYSLLYGNVSGLEVVDKILYVKIANEETSTIVDEIASYSAELAKELEMISEDYPSIRIDLDPLPEVEKAKQAAAQKQRVLSFVPIVGRTGANFERTLLLTLSGGLNQLRFLCQVIAEEETNEQRREKVLVAGDRFKELYVDTLKLLNEEYYKDNTFDASEFE